MNGTRCAQAGDEGDIPEQPVQLGHHHGALALMGGSEGRSQLRPAIERIGSGLDLLEVAEDRDPFGFGEAGAGCSLCLNAQPGSALVLR